MCTYGTDTSNLNLVRSFWGSNLRRAGVWSQDLKQRLWRKVTCWFFQMASLWNTEPPDHNGPVLPSNKMLHRLVVVWWRCSLNWGCNSQMPLACVQWWSLTSRNSGVMNIVVVSGMAVDWSGTLVRMYKGKGSLCFFLLLSFSLPFLHTSFHPCIHPLSSPHFLPLSLPPSFLPPSFIFFPVYTPFLSLYSSLLSPSLILLFLFLLPLFLFPFFCLFLPPSTFLPLFSFAWTKHECSCSRCPGNLLSQPYTGNGTCRLQ